MTHGSNGGKIAYSILWTGLAAVVNYIVTFILTSYITENIGAEAYGFVSLAKTVANYASILTTALNSFASRFISIEYHKGNHDKANQYFTSVFMADVFLGIIVLLAVLVPIFNLQKLLNISPELEYGVKVLFFLDFINFVLVSSGTAFLAAAVVKNRMDITGKIKSISYISEMLFMFAAFSLGNPSIIYVGLGLIVASLILMILNYAATRKLTPELKIRVRSFSKKAVKNLVVNGFWNSVNSLGNLLNGGLDLWVTNTMLSALQMGQMAIVKTVTTIFSTLYSTVSSPFLPSLLKAYAKQDKKELVRIFNLGIKVSGLFSNLAFAGFFSLGAIYYGLWTPSQDSILLHHVTIIAVLGGIVEGAVYPLYYTYTLTLKNRVPCFVTVASGFANVATMVIWIKYFDYGFYGVVITTAVLSWIVNFIFNPQYSAYCLDLKRWTFYPILLRHIGSCIVMTICFKFLTSFIYPSTWIGLIGVVFFCTAIGSIIHILIVFNKEDYAMVINKVSNRRKKK